MIGLGSDKNTSRFFFVMSCLVLMSLRSLPRIGEDPLEEPNNLMPYVAQVKAWGPESSWWWWWRWSCMDRSGDDEVSGAKNKGALKRICFALPQGGYGETNSTLCLWIWLGHRGWNWYFMFILVFFCGFSSNWILPYFPLSVRHRHDISHCSHI